MRPLAWVWWALALWLAAWPSTATAAEAPGLGETLFETRCRACHERPVGRTPNRATLAVMSSGAIIDALTNGAMAPMAAGLSDADKQAVADYLTRPAGGLSARGVDVKCAANPPIRETDSDWTGVGADARSTRFQPNPGFGVADVPRLRVKWAFAMPGGSMPTVIGEWLFIANRTGKYYALDPASGCVRWVVEGVGARATPPVVRSDLSPSGWLTVIGERNRVVRALDAETGRDLWRSAPLDTHPAAVITGAPLVVGEQIFVPISSVEEGSAIQSNYPCCSFQGALAALDLRTGKLAWVTRMIDAPVRSTRLNSAGVMMQGPAGAAIWSAPTFDVRRGLVYVATGDSYTDVEVPRADAIVAIEAASGKIRWANQVTEGDNWIVGCTNLNRPANCPLDSGPDHDFGASPILFGLPRGRDILVAGQKSGMVYGLDPDTGRTVWTRQVGAGSSLGGIEWGMAADRRRVFVANADTWNLIDEVLRPLGQSPLAAPAAKARPGLSALDPATGKLLWTTPAPVAPCRYAGDRTHEPARGACLRAQSQAPSAAPGMVFSGTMDGWFRAYDAASGKILWADSTTARTYDTVNQIAGQPGGSLDALGPALAGGRVFVMSGYSGAVNTGGNSVNVLLAYSVDGR